MSRVAGGSATGVIWQSAGGVVEFGLATWRRGEQGDETIARARSDLAGSAAPLAG